MPTRSSTAHDNLFTKVRRAINAADPEGLLRMGAPEDEYDQEAGRLAAAIRAMDAPSVSAIEAALQDVWTQLFDLTFPGREDHYRDTFHALAVDVMATIEPSEAPRG